MEQGAAGNARLGRRATGQAMNEERVEGSGDDLTVVDFLSDAGCALEKRRQLRRGVVG